MRINPLLVQSLASLRTALETQKNAAAEQEKLIRTQRTELGALWQDKLLPSQSQSTDLNDENDGQGLQILLAKIQLPKRRKVHHNSELLSTKAARVPDGIHSGYAANEISDILERDELPMPDVSTTISPWAVLSWMVPWAGLA